MFREHYPVKQADLDRLARSVRQAELRAKRTRLRLDRMIRQLREDSSGESSDTEDGFRTDRASQ